MTKDDAVMLCEGILSIAYESNITESEAYALQMAINSLKDSKSVEYLQKEIERLKYYNRLYYQKISDFINLYDKWKSSKGNPDEQKYYQKECMEIEKWMRQERDRGNSILNKKNDRQLTLDMV